MCEREKEREKRERESCKHMPCTFRERREEIARERETEKKRGRGEGRNGNQGGEKSERRNDERGTSEQAARSAHYQDLGAGKAGAGPAL